MKTKAIFHSKHVKALDGLRGYAAFIVTFYHAILFQDEHLVENVLSPAIDKVNLLDYGTKFALVFLNGSTAVLLFYVLSGAVLCQSLLRDQFNSLSILLFIVRRILRLFPALILCMVAMWMISIGFQHFHVQSYPVISFLDAAKNALLLEDRIHGPSTSIQIEALATPFILIFAFVYKSYSIAISAILFALSIFAIQRPELTFSLPNMHASVFVFFSGMLIALPQAKFLFSVITSRQLLLLLIAAVALRSLVHIESLPGFIAQVILLATLVGFIRHSIQPTSLHLFLETKFSQFLGRISYSYYLLNVPILHIIWFSPLQLPQWLNSSLGTLTAGLIVGFIAALATLPFAYLSHKYCEVYFINLARNISEKYLLRNK